MHANSRYSGTHAGAASSEYTATDDSESVREAIGGVPARCSRGQSLPESGCGRENCDIAWCWSEAGVQVLDVE